MVAPTQSQPEKRVRLRVVVKNAFKRRNSQGTLKELTDPAKKSVRFQTNRRNEIVVKVHNYPPAPKDGFLSRKELQTMASENRNFALAFAAIYPKYRLALRCLINDPTLTADDPTMSQDDSVKYMSSLAKEEDTTVRGLEAFASGLFKSHRQWAVRTVLTSLKTVQGRTNIRSICEKVSKRSVDVAIALAKGDALEVQVMEEGVDPALAKASMGSAVFNTLATPVNNRRAMIMNHVAESCAESTQILGEQFAACGNKVTINSLVPEMA